MVISASIRRRAELAASRIGQAAASGDVEPVLAMAAQSRHELARCRVRWESLPAPMRRELAAPTRDRHGRAGIARQLAGVRDEIRALRQDLQAGNHAGAKERLAGIAGQVAEAAADCAAWREYGSGIPPRAQARSGVRHGEVAQPAWLPDDATAAEAGDRLLRDLAAGPSQITSVGDWLQPGHFAQPLHAEVYTLMRDMSAAGKPVDPVTVAWEAVGRGLDLDAADLDGGTAAFAVPNARKVRQLGLLAQATQAGQEIQVSAAHASPQLAVFLRDAAARIDQLSAATTDTEPANHCRLPGGGHARPPIPRQVQPVHDTQPEATR
jgi:hypothetical protein